MSEYFLGVMLPEDFTQEVEKWRRAFSAPRTVPHITLIPPFRWSRTEEELVNVLAQRLEKYSAFPIAVGGLGNFGHSVIFIDVKASKELLDVHNALKTQMVECGVRELLREKPYRPHLTLATRLSPEQFAQYKAQLSGYSPSREFICSEVTLFKMQVQGEFRRWLAHRKFSLK